MPPKKPVTTLTTPWPQLSRILSEWVSVTSSTSLAVMRDSISPTRAMAIAYGAMIRKVSRESGTFATKSSGSDWGHPLRGAGAGMKTVAMATQMSGLLHGAIDDLRIHPVDKWIRAVSGGRTLVDSRRAVLVWEPRRIVPAYAVPEDDVAADLVPTDGAGVSPRPVPAGPRGEVLDPSSPFAAHTMPGTPLTLRTPDGDFPGAAFRPADPDLAGHVVLDWNGFGQWYEEAEPVMGHPHDPFTRIDCLRSTRRVRVSSRGVTLADSSRAVLLFETSLPTRYYLPREDVATDLLEPSPTHTICAYKGQASYWSARVDGAVLPDVVWSYESPLHDGVPVRGLLAFLTERADLDLEVDGRPQARPRRPGREPRP